MRRSSVITILLLVAIIIGLVIAIIVTNLPQKNDEVAKEDIEVTEKENGNDKKEINSSDSVNYIALDNDVAVKMATMIYPYGLSNDLFESKIGVVTQDDIIANDKLKLAYYYKARKNSVSPNDGMYMSVIKKVYMDEAMKELFGDTTYTSEDFFTGYNTFRYRANEEAYYALYGGGGGFSPTPIVGIYKIEEYGEDRYEAYVKYLVREPRQITDSDNLNIGTAWDVYSYYSMDKSTLGTYCEITLAEKAGNKYDTIDDLTSGVELKSFAKPDTEYNTYVDIKLLSKYFEEATEYKVTFQKNEDGSFYWAKSEIIK